MSRVVNTSMSVCFQGGESRSGSLAWGQQALWNAIRRTRPEDQYFNFSREFTPTGSLDLEDAAGALARVLARHEALRTTLVADEALPQQVVHSSGQLDVEVRRCAAADVDSVAAETAAEYEGRTFDYVGEYPLRVAFVTTDDAAASVARVVFCFCHLAADFAASQVVLDDLAGYLLEDAASGPEAPQPLDLVATQKAPSGNVLPNVLWLTGRPSTGVSLRRCSQWRGQTPRIRRSGPAPSRRQCSARRWPPYQRGTRSAARR